MNLRVIVGRMEKERTELLTAVKQTFQLGRCEPHLEQHDKHTVYVTLVKFRFPDFPRR